MPCTSKKTKTTDAEKRKAIYHQIDGVRRSIQICHRHEYDKMMSSMGAQGTNAFTSFEQTVYTTTFRFQLSTNITTKAQGERFRNPILRIFHTELEAV